MKKIHEGEHMQSLQSLNTFSFKFSSSPNSIYKQINPCVPPPVNECLPHGGGGSGLRCISDLEDTLNHIQLCGCSVHSTEGSPVIHQQSRCQGIAASVHCSSLGCTVDYKIEEWGLKTSQLPTNENLYLKSCWNCQLLNNTINKML